MKPMLARTYNPATFSSFPCYLQPKLNGVRALYSNGQFQSRDEKLWPEAMLRHLSSRLQTLPFLNGIILDGELYKHGWSLQRINGAIAINSNSPRSDTHEIEYHIFDAIVPTNQSELFSSRYERIGGRIGVEEGLLGIHRAPWEIATCKEDIEKYFLKQTSLGYEGIMLRPDGAYELGARYSPRVHKDTEYRSEYLWKYKKWMDAEFLCVGTTAGIGKADIGIGALVCCSLLNSRQFNVGGGLEDSERIAFATSPPIGKYIKVKFIGYSEDGLPLNPSFLCVMP